ncbi:unnamed protein product, partial [Meganyctiphanes norvegica]
IMMSCVIPRYFLVNPQPLPNIVGRALTGQVHYVSATYVYIYTSKYKLKDYTYVCTLMINHFYVPFVVEDFGICRRCPVVRSHMISAIATMDRGVFEICTLIRIHVDCPVSRCDKKFREEFHLVIHSITHTDEKPFPCSHWVYNIISIIINMHKDVPITCRFLARIAISSVCLIRSGGIKMQLIRTLVAPLKRFFGKNLPFQPILLRIYQRHICRTVLIKKKMPKNTTYTKIILLTAYHSIIKVYFKNAHNYSSLMPKPKKWTGPLMYDYGMDVPVNILPQSMTSEAKRFYWTNCFKLCQSEQISSSENGKIPENLLSVSLLEGDKENQWAIKTDENEKIDCGLILRSIGYKSTQIDADLPFDKKMGIIPNKGGRVIDHPGLYVSGWVGTGPVGVILSTMTSGFTTGKQVVEDLISSAASAGNGVNKEGSIIIKQILKDKGIQSVSFSEWCQLDDYEKSFGKDLKKPREKITSVEKMLQIINNVIHQ